MVDQGSRRPSASYDALPSAGERIPGGWWRRTRGRARFSGVAGARRCRRSRTTASSAELPRRQSGHRSFSLVEEQSEPLDCCHIFGLRPALNARKAWPLALLGLVAWYLRSRNSRPIDGSLPPAARPGIASPPMCPEPSGWHGIFDPNYPNPLGYFSHDCSSLYYPRPDVGAQHYPTHRSGRSGGLLPRPLRPGRSPHRARPVVAHSAEGPPAQGRRRS